MNSLGNTQTALIKLSRRLIDQYFQIKGSGFSEELNVKLIDAKSDKQGMYCGDNIKLCYII